MTKLKLFKCDRCGRNFEVVEGKDPFTLKYIAEREESTLHLCDDCEVTFHIFMKYVKEFDELAEKLVREEEE